MAAWCVCGIEEEGACHPLQQSGSLICLYFMAQSKKIYQTLIHTHQLLVDEYTIDLILFSVYIVHVCIEIWGICFCKILMNLDNRETLVFGSFGNLAHPCSL